MLAGTAAALLAEHGPESLADARLAVAALARRAVGFAHFVECYRAFSETPAVRTSWFAGAPWAAELERRRRAPWRWQSRWRARR